METLYAYLAGAIDIEGRIVISRALTRDRQRAYYSATIALSDSDAVLPDLCQATFPARRLQYQARNRKQMAWHMWEAVGQKAREPLLRLLPYLRIKHRQAELALCLLNLMQREKPGPSQPLTLEQEHARRLLYEEARLESRPKRIHR
jgi:hypothetical protein